MKQMEALLAGNLDLEKGLRMTKIANAINESFRTEAQMAQLHATAGRTIEEPGKMPIGDPSYE